MKLLFQHLLLIFFVLFAACTSNKSLLEKEILKTTSSKAAETISNNRETFQIPKGNQIIKNESPLLIQANDILSIILSSQDEVALAPFKATSNTEQDSKNDNYLVNKSGEIELPTIGKIKVNGLEIEVVKQKIIESLSPYFMKPPMVKVQLINFRVNVNGEVKSPGTFAIENARLTIIEAITMAGDFTRYAERDSVLVIREQNGIREFGYINFNSSNIFTSNYFYLKQNDVIHVRVDIEKLKESKDKN